MTQRHAAPPPALARGGIDRAATEREEDGLLDRLRADPATRVVAVHADRGLVTGSTVRTVSPAEIVDPVHWAFLGRDDAGVAVLVAAAAAGDPAPATAPDDSEWAALRAVGGDMAAVDAGMLVEAVTLGRWLVDAPFCPACGGGTQVRQAGWSRRCVDCAREHFPRADPAVIVAVQSHDEQRLLLGQNALWADRNMYSTFAGFVEAGESLESAIVREIAEEAGVAITDSEYRGSQAWPYPRSLMLGFRARCAPEPQARADGEEIVDVRWFTRGELSTILGGDGGAEGVTLPAPASIAHRLIVDWVRAL